MGTIGETGAIEIVGGALEGVAEGLRDEGLEGVAEGLRDEGLRVDEG